MDRERFLQRFVAEDPVFLPGARLLDEPDGVVLQASQPPNVSPRRVTFLAERAHQLWGAGHDAGEAAAVPLVAVRFLVAAGEESDELVRVTEAGLTWNADGLVHSVLWMWGDPDAQQHYDSFAWTLERLSRFDDLATAGPEAAREAVRRVLREGGAVLAPKLCADLAAFLVRFSRHRRAFADGLREPLVRRLEVADLDLRHRAYYQECLDKLDAPDAPTGG